MGPYLCTSILFTNMKAAQQCLNFRHRHWLSIKNGRFAGGASIQPSQYSTRRQDLGLSAWSGGGCCSWQGLRATCLHPLVQPSSFPFWVTQWSPMGLIWLLKKLPVAAEEKGTIWKKIFFLADAEGHGPHEVLDLESVFCQAPTLLSMIWDESEALLASFFSPKNIGLNG